MPKTKASPKTRRAPLPVDAMRMLGGVKVAARACERTDLELERKCLQAAERGCSLREIADAAGFDSHHRVQLILARAREREAADNARRAASVAGQQQ